MTERDVYPAVAGRVTAFGRPRAGWPSSRLILLHVRVRSCTFTSVPVLGAPLRSTCASDSKSPTRLFNLVERTSLIKIIFRFIRWRSVDDEAWTIPYPPRDLTADSITSGPSEIPRLDAYLVSESTESSSRHCRQRATQSRRRASRTRYTRYPPPYDPPRGATCYMYEVPVISNSLAPIRCSDVAGGAAKLQDASGMML